MVICPELILNTYITTSIKPITQLASTVISIIIPYYLLLITACFSLASNRAFYSLVACQYLTNFFNFVTQYKTLAEFTRFALFQGIIAHLLLRSVEKFTFFSLGELVEGEVTRFNNILVKNSKRIARLQLGAIQEGVYYNIVDGW